MLGLSTKFLAVITSLESDSSDYAKLVLCWALKATQMRFDPNCICADFDHKYEGSGTKYRVFNSDYTILVAGWALKETQMKPWCPVP